MTKKRTSSSSLSPVRGVAVAPSHVPNGNGNHNEEGNGNGKKKSRKIESELENVYHNYVEEGVNNHSLADGIVGNVISDSMMATEMKPETSSQSQSQAQGQTFPLSPSNQNNNHNNNNQNNQNTTSFYLQTTTNLPSSLAMSMPLSPSSGTLVSGTHSFMPEAPEGWILGAERIQQSKNRTQTLGGTVLSDIWKHFYMSMNRSGTTKRNRAKCIYCQKELDGRVYRMMNHCESCRNIPPFERAEVMRLKIASKAAQAAQAATSTSRGSGTESKIQIKKERKASLKSKKSSLPLELIQRTPAIRTIVKTTPRQHGFKRILVTGGAGFLGAHLCRRLLELGNEVLCMDNLYTSQRSSVLPLMAAYPHLFEFVRHDVTDPYKCEVDEIYNLACPASPIHYQYDPIKTTEVSTIGSMNALNLARQMGCRVFQASTSEVYGDSQMSTQSEDYYGNVNCTGIRSCYDEGKRMAESLFFDYHRQYNTDIRVARIFNTYGPGMRPNDGRVVSNFIMQALQGQDITIYGDGTQTRSFCYVDDLIDGIINFMENRQGFVGPVNLGNPTEITILDLAKSILQLTDSKSKIVFADLPGDDPKRRHPDISLAQKMLNWEPKVGLEEGLRKTIEYFILLSAPNYHEAMSQFDAEGADKYEGHDIKMKQDI